MNQHFERDVFLWQVAKFCENFAQKRKLGFRCFATPINMTSMRLFVTYRVKVEQTILFMKTQLISFIFSLIDCNF